MTYDFSHHDYPVVRDLECHRRPKATVYSPMQCIKTQGQSAGLPRMKECHSSRVVFQIFNLYICIYKWKDETGSSTFNSLKWSECSFLSSTHKYLLSGRCVPGAVLNSVPVEVLVLGAFTCLCYILANCAFWWTKEQMSIHWNPIYWASFACF